LALGIQSEVGRKDALTFNIPMYLSDGSRGAKIRAQTSIFDPVLTELCLSWWCPPGGVVCDPFAGGSVRGVVASVMGYRYWGCELREEQVAANYAQMTPATRGQYKPRWVCGDSTEELPKAPMANFLFSCPPYGNLERYSDDPRDISNMDWFEFLKAYKRIIVRAVDRLRNNSFAVFVVANYRNKDTGNLYDFVGATRAMFGECGVGFYNEIILVNAVGTAAMRANTSFIRGARKVVKSHQNVLVFIKGDPKKAAAKIEPFEGEVETRDTIAIE
jgi:hypothetical protein